jgi:hypothetical protein
VKTIRAVVLTAVDASAYTRAARTGVELFRLEADDAVARLFQPLPT